MSYNIRLLKLSNYKGECIIYPSFINQDLIKIKNMKCLNLINIEFDEEDYNSIYQVYKNTLLNLLSEGYKNIGLPIFDVENKILFDSIMNLLDELDLKNICLNITVFGVLREKEENVVCLCSPRLFNKEDLSSPINIIKRMKEIGQFDIEDLYIPSRIANFAHPFDFILNYIDDNNLNEIDIFKNKIDRRTKSRFKTAKNLKKKYVYLLIYILNFNFATANEFMMICGHSFSPLDKLDNFMRDYLLGKYEDYEVSNMLEFQMLALDECGDYPSFENYTRNK